MCQLRVSWQGLSATRKEDLQFIEQRFLGLAFVICRKAFHANSNQCLRPTPIEDLISTAHATVSLKKGLCIIDLLFVQRQKTLSATPLERSLVVGSVCDEIFCGSEQKPTEPAFLPIDAGIDFVLDQMGKKALREILGIMHGVSTAAHETVKRCPIVLAKLRNRSLRHLRLTQASSRRQNYAPVR